MRMSNFRCYVLLILAFSFLYTYAQKREVNQESYFLVPESFCDFGSWRIETGGDLGYTLVGVNPQSPRSASPAIAKIGIKNTGEYRIWVHARDFTYQPGSRYFNLMVNDILSPVTFGKHGKNKYQWTDGGIYNLKAGENIVKLIDTSAFYARCDGILITADLKATPSDDYETLIKQAPPEGLSKNMESQLFPTWAKADLLPENSLILENSRVKVVFYQVKDKKYGKFVQNEIYIKDNGQWIKVKDKTEEHGYLMLKAAKSCTGHWIQDYAFFNQLISVGETMLPIKTDNVYKSALSTWLIPNGMERIAKGKVSLTFNTFNENSDESISVIWQLDEGEADPKVTLDAIFHKDGAYSFGLFSGREYADDEYESALAPFRIMNKRVPEAPKLITEHYLSTPMGSVSLPVNNTISQKPFTTAIVVDPGCLARGYVYRETARMGICMRGPEGGVRGNLFAPLLGSEYCTFKAGSKYRISYYVINRLGDWFDTYKHIAQDIFNVHDYRSNYYTSLNEAIYNTTDLMMDDRYGGWDPVDKAHYNMEEKDLTSVANPMTAMQRYLLTENEEILTKRAIPTVANLLTRERLHFKRFDSKGGANYLGGVKKPASIGKPIQGYNLNVFGGLYEMSHGLTPSLLAIGIDKADHVINQYGNIPAFSNDLSLYHYTGEEKYLDLAKKKADKYLQEVVYGNKFNAETPGFSTFINISYYPNLASLLDIYQITKEQRYLDAAIRTGQLLSTTVWVPGIDGNKGTTPYVINPKKTLERPFMLGHNFWWHGSKQWRLGNPYGVIAPPRESKVSLEGDTVPGWLPARVGLGLEQCSTFNEALNIYMNTWAGDMMKLAALSGEEYFAVVAKNAIIGRFGNYAGYYQNRYITHQMRANYPYKGPDLTSIYFHHIPVFLTMLEDFLINQVWKMSNMKIEFPAIRQQGYAYFNSNQYGFKSGRFYDISDVWLWNDRNIIEPDSKEINYLPARKNGLLAVALVNEADQVTTTTITLGANIGKGRHFSGKGVLYEQDGTKKVIDVCNGKFTITIPPKGMQSIAIPIPTIKAPQYAKVGYNRGKVQMDKTIAMHSRGKAYLLQFNPNEYFAYVYITDLPKDTKKMKLHYKVGKKRSTIEVNQYPFETIVKVDDITKDFSYDIEILKNDGSSESIQGNTLKSLAIR